MRIKVKELQTAAEKYTESLYSTPSGIPIIQYGSMFRIADKKYIGKLKAFIKKSEEFLKKFDIDESTSKQIAANLFTSGDEPDDEQEIIITEKSSITAATIYGCLYERIKKNQWKPTLISRQEISEETGFSKRTVSKWIAEFVRTGILKQEIFSYMGELEQPNIQRTYSIPEKTPRHE